MYKLWPQLRAAFVVFHLIAIVVIAFPSLNGVKRMWNDPTVKGEIAAWSGFVNKFGFDLTATEFEDLLLMAIDESLEVRREILKPFDLYYRYFGTMQSWQLFPVAQRYPSKLHVDILQGSHWKTVFEMRNAELDWQGHLLNHHRMRKAHFMYSWDSYQVQYKRLCFRLAKIAKTDFVDASALRCRFYNYKSPSPDEIKSAVQIKGQFKNNHVVRLR